MEVNPLIVVSMKSLTLRVVRANYEAFERILWRFSEENGGAGVCSICYDSQTGDWKITVKTGNISMFGPTFCCKKVASRAIENSLGIKRATYYEALGKLEEVGYLYRENGALKFRTLLLEKEKVISITEEEAKIFGKLSLWGIRVWAFSHFNHGVVSPQEVLD